MAHISERAGQARRFHSGIQSCLLLGKKPQDFIHSPSTATTLNDVLKHTIYRAVRARRTRSEQHRRDF